MVITNYNKGPLLLRAIDSVLKQSAPPGELVLVDDCSDEESTLNALKNLPVIPFASKKILLKVRGGASAAMNKGIDSASRPIVMLLDADDELPPNAVEDISECLANHPHADFIYGDVLRTTGQQEIMMRGRAFSTPTGSIDARKLAKKWELHGTSPVRKEFFQSFGGFDSKNPRTHDSDFFRRAIVHGALGVYLPSHIYTYHLDASQNNQGVDPLTLSFSWFRNIDFYYSALPSWEFLLLLTKKVFWLVARVVRAKLLAARERRANS